MSGLLHVDLTVLIESLSKQFSNVVSVYLFGSRAYQTNSKRSDIDLLISFNSEKAVCDRSKVLKFQEGYPYIDIFINREYSAQSVVNNSEILRKDASIPLERQLDAILIWDIKNGFIVSNI